MTAPEAAATTQHRGGAAAPALLVLKNRPDFLRAARARRHATPGFVVQARRRAPQEPDGSAIRVGFTCSKKVGNAVARNRAKRRLREIARHVLPRAGLPGWDYVLIGRADTTATRDIRDMATELDSALKRLHGPPA